MLEDSRYWINVRRGFRMIKFSGVSKKFGEVTALENLSFEIKQGEFVFIIGPSGAGKSTIVNLILKNYPPTEGLIAVGGLDIQKIKKSKIPEYRRKIGVVFQDFKLLPDLTVYENVALALRIFGANEKEIRDQVNEVLQLVNLTERANFFPAQLAGGELQRVGIARAVITQPEIILADEPTGNLDIETAKKIVGLLKKVNDLGKTVLMTTHNFEIVNQMRQRVISIDKGRLISDQEKGKYQFKNNETAS